MGVGASFTSFTGLSDTEKLTEVDESDFSSSCRVVEAVSLSSSLSFSFLLKLYVNKEKRKQGKKNSQERKENTWNLSTEVL